MEGIPLIRAVLRRMTLLARLRAEVERGNSVDAVMASAGQVVVLEGERRDRAAARRAGAPDLLAKAIGAAARGRAAGQGVGRRRPDRGRRGIVRDLPPGGAAALAAGESSWLELLAR